MYMKRPPMKNTVTNSVARICDRKSCVRERMSRNVQMMRLSQKMTVNATTKPIISPNALLRVSSNEPDPDAVGPSKIAICANTGPLPLSEYSSVYYYNVQDRQKDNKY